MLPGELSIISLLNVFYSFYKPFTRIFSDNNYDKYIGIAEMIFSMLLPIVLFYIGKLLKKIAEKSTDFNIPYFLFYYSANEISAIIPLWSLTYPFDVSSSTLYCETGISLSVKMKSIGFPVFTSPQP